MIDQELLEEAKMRLADRYTAAELADLLDVPVHDIIEEYWWKVLRNTWILEEIGFEFDIEDTTNTEREE